MAHLGHGFIPLMMEWSALGSDFCTFQPTIHWFDRRPSGYGESHVAQRFLGGQSLARI
ncbi:hypothetical protein BDV40DRAFT_259437 [Aspergillus tamarii]|uniref:Uncharacterized protein n=1 Tax=Aspergillus tamarii TaxID=41984 RepID=A0A5N6V1Q1_ASPTM|nr:hypothetical protein BDV40DRAFT_259437 [Aspergillus tamarii]